jgi:hypothetical protein
MAANGLHKMRLQFNYHWVRQIVYSKWLHNVINQLITKKMTEWGNSLYIEWWHNVKKQSDETKWWTNVIKQSDEKMSQIFWSHMLMTESDDKEWW